MPRFQPPPHDNRYPITINQNFIAGKRIFQAQCVPSVSNATSHDLVYGITSSDNFFTINSTSGVVSLTVDARDLPGGGPFTPIIYCKYADADDGFNSVELVVSYQIENEFVPRFMHSDQVDVRVREDHLDREGPFIAQLNITDDDLEPCNIVTFTIVSGNDDGEFRIGSENGVLELNRELDYDTHRKHNLTVQATNTECGNRRFSARATVYVYVTDIDDEHPTFNQRVYNLTFDEEQQPVNFVQLRCSDVDTPEAQIVYEEDFSRDNPFTVNHRTGYVSATQVLDYEQQTSFHLTFTCYDLLNPGNSDMAVVRVQVNPINEYLPQVKPNFAFLRFNYTSPVGTLLASARNNSQALVNLVVTDRDRGLDHNKVQFKFARDNEYQTYFDLDSDSGDLTLIRQFDFDICGSDTIRSIPLRIVACDTLQDPGRLESCPTFVIHVAVVSPSCTLTFFRENYTVDISESARIGSELLEVHCGVIGRGRNNTSQQQTIEIFSPNPQFSQTLRIEGNLVILQEPLDYEAVRQFVVYLQCSDIDDQESIASVHVQVLPENDSPPYFEKPLYIFKASTEQINSLPVTIGYITAMDDDQGITSNLTYALTQNGDFDSQNDGTEHFTISTMENGMLAVNMINLPSRDTNVLDISVSDGLSAAQSSILIYIPDRFKETSSSSSMSVDQCGTVCIVLLITFVAFVLVVCIVFLVIAYICYAGRRKQKDRPGAALTNLVELQDNKSHMMGYSSLVRNNTQGQRNGAVAGQL